MTKQAVLLLLDLQNGMFSSNTTVYRGEQLLKNIKHLIEKARMANVPVIYVQHTGKHLTQGTWDWQIHQSVSPNEGDIVVQKNSPDSFKDTTLKCVLDSMDANKIILAGIATDFCVDTTCRRAFSLGYNVVLVEDGHSTWDTPTLTSKQVIKHHNYILGSKFAKTINTAEIIF